LRQINKKTKTSSDDDNNADDIFIVIMVVFVAVTLSVVSAGWQHITSHRDVERSEPRHAYLCRCSISEQGSFDNPCLKETCRLRLKCDGTRAETRFRFSCETDQSI